VRSGHRIRAGAGEPERLDEILDTIDESAARLHRFVEGYARFARLPEPRREEVELISFLEQVRGIEPFTLRGPVPRRTAAFDAAQMQQVLVNLVKNAREAGSPRERIELEVHEVPKGGLPFYSSKRDGTGLGLALSREIVEAHGGHLHLAAREGGGMIVTLDLPAGSQS
jgi:signal transduction histidine kinase